MYHISQVRWLPKTTTDYFRASVDLSGKSKRFVKLNANQKVELCEGSEIPIGVLKNKPKKDEKCYIQHTGITEVLFHNSVMSSGNHYYPLSNTIQPNDKIESTNYGKARKNFGQKINIHLDQDPSGGTGNYNINVNGDLSDNIGPDATRSDIIADLKALGSTKEAYCFDISDTIPSGKMYIVSSPNWGSCYSSIENNTLETSGASSVTVTNFTYPKTSISAIALETITETDVFGKVKLI